ncbi:other/RAN protein kinase [Pseudohyphozyma bogoriensis]|nr:other/RAN protein kinase [Pseudohyphozyma bogoriensis]
MPSGPTESLLLPRWNRISQYHRRGVERQASIQRYADEMAQVSVLQALVGQNNGRAVVMKYFLRIEDLTKRTEAIQEFRRLQGLLARPGGSTYLVGLRSRYPPDVTHPYMLLQPLDFSLHSLIQYTNSRDMIFHRSLLGTIFGQLVRAVDWFHRQNIFLMDLKPDNVMLVKEGGRLRLKLVDFGLLATVGSAALQGATISYCPPEALDGRYTGNFGGDSWDIWTLGVVLQEMVIQGNLYSLLMSGAPGGVGLSALQLRSFVEGDSGTDYSIDCLTGIRPHLSSCDMLTLLGLQ